MEPSLLPRLPAKTMTHISHIIEICEIESASREAGNTGGALLQGLGAREYTKPVLTGMSVLE